MTIHRADFARTVGGLLFAAVLASCAESPDDQRVAAIGANGTGISASKTATGFWERRVTYDWSLTKSVTPDHVTNGPGSTTTVEYTLTATRTVASDVMVYGSRGQICVTNEGTIATEGLAILDQVQVHAGSGGWVDLAGASASIAVSEQLDPGESRCYPYEVTFSPTAGARYRNTARATITNHSGHLGVAFGPGGPNGVTASFTIPTSYTWVYADTEADLGDALTCPTGLSCSPASHGPWHLTGSQTITYRTDLTTDTTVACDTELTAENTATLTESTSGETRTASASVVVDSGECAAAITTAEGCTPGYWKNHPVSWRGYFPTSLVGDVFPPSASVDLDGYTLIQGLAFRGGSTDRGAAEILLRAAIAATLNGAHPDVGYTLSATDVISQTNAALASGDRATMISLAAILDGYNNAGCPLH